MQYDEVLNKFELSDKINRIVTDSARNNIKTFSKEVESLSEEDTEIRLVIELMFKQHAQDHAEVRQKLLVDAYNEEQAMINQFSDETVRVVGKSRQALELLMEQTDELVSDNEDAVTEKVRGR